jgi:hypothetical protein
VPPPRKNRKTPEKAPPLKLVPDTSKKAPNGNTPGENSSVARWERAGRPIGKNLQHKMDQAVLNSGPDMPPGKFKPWLPTAEEVPPKPTTEPEMEWPGIGHMRDGHPEWQLYTVMEPNAKALEADGLPFVLGREWRVRWVPPEERRCQARGIGKFSEWQGNRCTMRAIKGGRVCFAHGGRLSTVRKAAQAALAQAALPAANKLVGIALTKRGVSDSDRIRAIVEILNRAGVEGRQTIELEIKPFQEVLQRVYETETGQKALGSGEEEEGVDFWLDEDEEGAPDGDG